ncbi:ribonuclease P protein component [Candidatus Parcubacteria bacterium]|nr:ribonuclease P protein component [Patescibacteria group bacterium]MBU4309755.1 ribonuclease P protein component [Patescibacteria group bacterium]MBU4431761.1 ribonuclease P protein component [Patescibacteria group bacterium]MBU4578094.1 ribonuclease P protein component [Patescibacteria group bacterium]MCG2696632.1 ribonuclease P protein component [Candidatus Parcubacteria bacterium]
MKYQSLTRKKDFDELFARGRGRKSNFLLLKFLPNTDGDTKVAIIVSKKISKLAVIRNRNKRKVRVALQSVDLKAGHNYALIILKDVSELGQIELEKDFGILVSVKK